MSQRTKHFVKSFLLKLSEQDYAELQEKSLHAEVSCSDYLRQCIFGRPVSAKELKALKVELQKIGVNLNQAIKAANREGMSQQIYDTTKLYMDDLKRIIQSAVGGVF